MRHRFQPALAVIRHDDCLQILNVAPSSRLVNTTAPCSRLLVSRLDTVEGGVLGYR